MATIERQTMEVKAKGLDLSNAKHVDKLRAFAGEKYPDFTVTSIDDGKAGSYIIELERRSTITRVSSDAGGNKKRMQLPAGVKTSDGEAMLKTYRDKYGPGWYMTSFEPVIGKAELTKLTQAQIVALESTAVALGVKPWDIAMSTRRDGGYDFTLPPTFIPSKHVDKLNEVAHETVGNAGWYVVVRPAERRASMIPSDPPTFPAVAPFPFDAALDPFDPARSETMTLKLGLKLPEAGATGHEEALVDLDAGPHTLIGGLSQSGKSVTINAAIFQMLARGGKLAIIDDPDKARDFDWCKKYLIPGGWGCDDEKMAAVTMRLIHREASRRANVLKRHGLNDWKSLKGPDAFSPLFVVVDEISLLLTLATVPKAGKDAPEWLIAQKDAAEEENAYRQDLGTQLTLAAAKLRFAGVFIVAANQVTNSTTGMPPKLRTNLHNKLLMGVAPTEANRKQMFSDHERVPQVPDHIRTSKAGKGVGSAEPAGGEAYVFKSYFATIADYASQLDALGIETTSHPEPTREQVAEVFGDGDGVEESKEAVAARRAKAGDPAAGLIPGMVDDNGRPLTGAAAAAAASKMLAAQGGA